MRTKVYKLAGGLILGFASLGGVALSADQTDPRADLIPGTDRPLLELVSDLDDVFQVEEPTETTGESSSAPCLDPAIDESRTVQTLRSENPVSTGARGPVYLRIKLTTEEFESSEEARSGLDRIMKMAGPDTGLSYAWDYLLAHGEHLYHLHADCLLAEEGFEQVVAQLNVVVQSADETADPSATCRCGGGCSQVTE